MRIQVNLSDEMVESVDKYSKMMGVSRSALCSIFIGQGIMSYDSSMEVLCKIGDKIGDNLLAEKTIKEVANIEKK